MLKNFFSIKCIAYGKTDTGRSRDHNEDAIRLNASQDLYLLADGMGGHEAGEVASKMAIETIEKSLVNHAKANIKSKNDVELAELTAVNKAIEKTNDKIHQANEQGGVETGRGMGTTIVGCWYLVERKMSVIFHVGDSRAYSCYKQELKQLTVDHSLLQLWKDNCFEGDKPSANVLIKALGPYAEVAPDVMLYPAKKGEKILLCSDGLNTMIGDEKILEILLQYDHSIEVAAEQLIIEANLAGGEDNISVLIIEYK